MGFSKALRESPITVNGAKEPKEERGGTKVYFIYIASFPTFYFYPVPPSTTHSEERQSARTFLETERKNVMEVGGRQQAEEMDGEEAEMGNERRTRRIGGSIPGKSLLQSQEQKDRRLLENKRHGSLSCQNSCSPSGCE